MSTYFIWMYVFAHINRSRLSAAPSGLDIRYNLDLAKVISNSLNVVLREGNWGKLC